MGVGRAMASVPLVAELKGFGCAYSSLQVCRFCAWIHSATGPCAFHRFSSSSCYACYRIIVRLVRFCHVYARVFGGLSYVVLSCVSKIV